MKHNDEWLEDKEHPATDAEREYQESITGTRGAGDPDAYGYPSQPKDTCPVVLPKADF